MGYFWINGCQILSIDLSLWSQPEHMMEASSLVAHLISLDWVLFQDKYVLVLFSFDFFQPFTPLDIFLQNNEGTNPGTHAWRNFSHEHDPCLWPLTCLSQCLWPQPNSMHMFDWCTVCWRVQIHLVSGSNLTFLGSQLIQGSAWDQDPSHNRCSPLFQPSAQHSLWPFLVSQSCIGSVSLLKGFKLTNGKYSHCQVMCHSLRKRERSWANLRRKICGFPEKPQMHQEKFFFLCQARFLD